MSDPTPASAAKATRSPQDDAPRDAALRWPIGLALATLVVIGAQGVLLASALRDPGFAVERDYHKKALAWDREKEAQAASDALGWRAVVTLDGAGLRVTITGRDGRAVEGAQVGVQAFANARAARVLSGDASHAGGGTYEARLRPDRPGIWVVRVTARRGADVFLDERRLEVSP